MIISVVCSHYLVDELDHTVCCLFTAPVYIISTVHGSGQFYDPEADYTSTARVFLPRGRRSARRGDTARSVLRRGRARRLSSWRPPVTANYATCRSYRVNKSNFNAVPGYNWRRPRFFAIPSRQRKPGTLQWGGGQ